MSTVKNIPELYTVNVPQMTVNGNLTVTGNSTNVYTDNLSVADNIVTINAGEAGAGVSLVYAGLEVDRGSLANVQLRWDETYDRWQLSNDGTTYANISTTSGSGSALTAVVQDTGPRLGGNLITNGFNVQFQTLLTANPPTAISGNIVLYADTVGSAGSGLFVVNSGTASDELVTKSKAIVFSIIL
jgi:hypothetical protein